ncbi:MAG: CARDB domain-containing protein [Planctomycetaceae bacterium]
MKRTYWYFAVTGISGLLITAAVADPVSKKLKTPEAKSQRTVQFFSRSGAEKSVSGSAADTGDHDAPLEIMPTSTEFEGNANREDDTPFQTRGYQRLRSVEDDAAPTFEEIPAGELSPSESTDETGEIIQTGLLRRRSRFGQSPSSSASRSNAQENQTAAEGTDAKQLLSDEQKTGAAGAGEEQLDLKRESDTADASVEDVTPAPPEAQDPDFEKITEEGNSARNDFDINLDSSGNRSSRSTEKSGLPSEDVQGLFDPREEDANEAAAPAQPRKQTTDRAVKPSNSATETRNQAGAQTPAQPAKTAATKPQAAKISNATDSRTLPAENTSQQPQFVKAGFGEPSSSTVAPAVTVTWLKQGTVNIGQTCGCDLVVRNTSAVAVENVQIDAYFPITVRLQKTEPAAEESFDHLTWTVSQLAAGKEYKIHIEFVPNERGDLPLTAQVRFTSISKSSMTVEEPMLKLAVKGPKEISLGDPASQIVVVTNPGTGTTQNVVLECTLTEGLAHKNGNQFKLEVGSLEAGESRQIRLPIEAILGGTQTVKIVANAGGSLTDTTESSIAVSAPSLELAVKGPGLRYLGRSATYTITVRNSGRAESSNIRVVHKVPTGFSFVSAGQGGRFNDADNTVLWFVGQLGQDESKEVTVELRATELGSQQHEVEALSDTGSPVTASTKTEVDGAVDLVVDVTEADDPVEVGSELAYEIKIRNDGTKSATNVMLNCTVPDGVVLQSAAGPSKYTSTLGEVSFESIPVLKPGESAVFTVIVKGQTEGQHRLRAHLTSESITDPIIDEELTRFYGE